MIYNCRNGSIEIDFQFVLEALTDSIATLYQELQQEIAVAATSVTAEITLFGLNTVTSSFGDHLILQLYNMLILLTTS